MATERDRPRARLIRPFEVAVDVFLVQNVRRLEIVVPFQAQAPPAVAKWVSKGFEVRPHVVADRIPEAPLEAWLAGRVSEADADAIVFDYVGFPSDALSKTAEAAAAVDDSDDEGAGAAGGASDSVDFGIARKPSELRRREIFGRQGKLGAALVDACERNASSMLRSVAGCDVLVETCSGGAGGALLLEARAAVRAAPETKLPPMAPAASYMSEPSHSRYSASMPSPV